MEIARGPGGTSLPIRIFASNTSRVLRNPHNRTYSLLTCFLSVSRLLSA